MFYIGCHLSASKGFAAMAETAVGIGANVFQFFTRNPRGGAAKDIDPADIAKARDIAKKHNFGLLLAHAPYTLNACAEKPDVLDFAFNVMRDDLDRMEAIPHNAYNFHPGSHVGQGTEQGIAKIADLLNRLLTEEQTTTVLLETMAGKGSEVGRSFEELRAIIDHVELADHLGVCFDTCHVWDAGYDIVHDLDGVLTQFDNVIGLDRLRAVHLNDSLNVCGAHKDRHAKIGAGEIGLDALVRVVNHEALRDLPFILETPNDAAGYAKEIALLRGKRE